MGGPGSGPQGGGHDLKHGDLVKKQFFGPHGGKSPNIAGRVVRIHSNGTHVGVTWPNKSTTTEHVRYLSRIK